MLKRRTSNNNVTHLCVCAFATCIRVHVRASVCTSKPIRSKSVLLLGYIFYFLSYDGQEMPSAYISVSFIVNDLFLQDVYRMNSHMICCFRNSFIKVEHHQHTNVSIRRQTTSKACSPQKSNKARSSPLAYGSASPTTDLDFCCRAARRPAKGFGASLPRGTISLDDPSNLSVDLENVMS